jgi:cyclohexadienyl dehydratase
MLRYLKLAAIAAITSLVLTAAAPAETGSRLDQIIGKGTLRVGMTGDYRPSPS